ncbi:MAG: TerC family protein [Verrucomicrobiales bacterium]
MFDWIATPDAWIALLTLTVLEIVLGIDNIIFISILSDRLPASQRKRARLIGLALAMLMRIALLFSLTWVMGLTRELFEVVGHGVSGRDLVLVFGGLFLLAKATFEIHANIEGHSSEKTRAKAVSFGSVLAQIALLDVVFSLDSVITAVGMADEIAIMVLAVMISIGVMMVAAGAVARFVNEHPTVKMLALSFLLLIGFTLVAEGFHVEIPKGYIYFAMGFSVFVELLNLKIRGRRPGARLSGREQLSEPPATEATS